MEKPERSLRPATRSITAGPALLSIRFRQEEDSRAGLYDFSDIVYQMRLQLPGVEVYGGFRNGAGEADSLNYLNLGANIAGALPLAGNQRAALNLPLWLSTDYTRIRETGGQQSESDQFRESSASIGLGAGAFLRPLDNMRIRAEFVPQIGFTVSSFGRDSGQLSTLNGRIRLHVDNVIERFGISVTYNYRWRRYAGSDDRFNYDMEGHHLGLGISF
ncbi:MAG: hypothetical protein R6U28_02155 [Cyclonatronaceae bacterium]